MLLALACALLAPWVALQDPTDPEQSPDGRTHFLGRAIAHTMHWTGASWLLRETREDEENGALLLRWLAARPGQVICDLGCGNGYHALPLAEAVGEAGKVFGVDVQPEMLKLLKLRADERGVQNLVCIEAAVDDPKLPLASCDLVLLVDVYHELSHPVRVMGHVRRALRPGGRVVLVEFRAEDPNVPIKAEHTMTKAQVVREMAEHGFALAEQFDELPWQHAMAFTVAAEPGPRHAAEQFARGFVAAVAAGELRNVAPFLAPGVAVDSMPALDSVPALAAPPRIELRAVEGGKVAVALEAAGLAPDALAPLLARDGEGRWQVEALRVPAPSRRLYAMHTGTGGGAVATQVALALELGFAGVVWHLDQLAAVRRACEARGGDAVAAYVVVDVATGPEALAPARAALQSLAGGPGMLWLGLLQRGVAARSPAGDAAAVTLLEQLLADADRTGVEVALYPHHAFWLETAEDALRLCERLRHPRLGLCFNLCHFLRTDATDDPTALLRACRAHLRAVTIHGADRAGADWATLIRPLDEGDFDLVGLLRTLDELAFTGPIGLQGFGIARPAREHLARSMGAWRAALEQLGR